MYKAMQESEGIQRIRRDEDTPVSLAVNANLSTQSEKWVCLAKLAVEDLSENRHSETY
jgi:hypothetical protein